MILSSILSDICLYLAKTVLYTKRTPECRRHARWHFNSLRHICPRYVLGIGKGARPQIVVSLREEIDLERRHPGESISSIFCRILHYFPSGSK